MFQLAVIIVIVVALILIQRNFSDAAASDDLSKLSKGKLKQNIAYARMIVKNNTDEQKRAEAPTRSKGCRLNWTGGRLNRPAVTHATPLTGQQRSTRALL
ncbi:MAG: hypothetical protein HC788_12650 [Sphingopyxis sp.]|nr:hypothetical protein [Sphingopyxis sp.]